MIERTQNIINKTATKLAIHNFIPVRERTFFTRSKRLRLRYITTVAAVSIIVGNIPFFQNSTHAALTAPENKQIASIEFAPDLAKQTHPQEDEYQDPEQSRVFPKNILQLASISKSIPTMSRPPKEPKSLTLKLGKGDTIAGLLQKSGINGQEAYKAVKALQKHFDVRKAKAGQSFEITFTEDTDSQNSTKIASMVMPLSAIKSVLVKKGSSDADFTAEIQTKDLKKRNYIGETEIQTSLYGSALRSGIPSPVIAKLIRMYSWSVDFQRDIRRGDKIQVMYEAYETPDGEAVKYGDIHFASLDVAGAHMQLYRFKTKDGHENYFDEKGHSAKKTLMRTPVDGARISSGFGMRKHPILGYNKMHKGMDFAASLGTPIYAAGDGVIDKIGVNGGYGNYMRIRHNSSLKTAYAHMHKYAKGMHKGKRVKQGQIIAYVGSTGRSTGPHLHYEVILNGKQVNPTRVDLPVGERLKGKELERFKAQKNRYTNIYAELKDSFDLASLNKKSNEKPS